MTRPTPEPLFDPGPLEELCEVGGPELVHELTELFLQDTPELLDALEAAASAEDWQALGAAAHTLRSTAFYLGALALSELARRIELAVAAGDPTEGAAIATRPREAFAEVTVALRTACAELSSG